ncbi:DNA adenine methylase [Ruminiclostridium josui]|uniref:DNA adenine methylase n=1 Tax=Ruminiclostridium josui TaxID=1499 RepID=UPI001FA7BAC3|nr:DNA adenine methylase [Ruminiclostridium josui]
MCKKYILGEPLEPLFFIKLHILKILYLDPPYYGTEKYYQAQIAQEDHGRLCRVLKNLKGKFILSYNDCGFVRELYKDFAIDGIERNHSLTLRYVDGDRRYSEVVIRNF